MQIDRQGKVVIAIPVLLTGGTEIQTLNLVKVLHGAGYGVVVLCYYEYESEMVACMKRGGAEVILLKLQREDGLLSLLKKLVIQFKELSPDIVHVQYVAPGLLPILAARLAQSPCTIATVHIAGKNFYKAKAKVLLRFAASLCDTFICVSKGVEKFWFGSSKLFIPSGNIKKYRHVTVYNAIDVERIQTVIAKVQPDNLKTKFGISGNKIIGIVGRLSPQKGHIYLFEAFSYVIKIEPNVSLLIVGDGSERNYLENKANALGIEEKIHWVGAIAHDEVLSLYKIMDVFAMPSLYEGFGLTAAEAMAAKIPVVASNVEGLNEVVQDGKTGILCPVGDKKMLAHSILELLTNPEKANKMGQKGKERAIALFSQEQFRKSVLVLYDTVRTK